MSKSTEKIYLSKLPHKINLRYSYYNRHFDQPFYVDKTLLIKKLYNDHNHKVIYAPPGFGKTLNMDMARRFFEIEVDKDGKPIELNVNEDKCCLKKVQTRSKNFKLFKGKKIFEDKQFVFNHFGKYPTIHVDFNELVGFNYEEILVQFRKILNETFKQHNYLENSSLWDDTEFNKDIFMKYTVEFASLSELDVKNGLSILAEFLHGYYGKAVYLFIDNLDAPVNSLVYQNTMMNEDVKKTIEFLQGAICQLLEGNKYVERSLSNSCQKFSRLILKDATNVAHYDFMNQQSIREFYGLEEAEVNYLLEKLKRLEDLIKIKENYKGYKTTSSDGRDIEIYHTLFIMNYLKFRRLNVYLPAGNLDKIKELICHAIVRPKIAQIMSEEFVRIKYNNCECLENSGIETLSNILCKGNVVECDDVDLFIQFVTQQGFFHAAEKDDLYLSLGICNRKVYSIIDEILGSIDSEIWDKRYDTLIDKESIENCFPKRTPRVESMIYLKILMNKSGGTSITYSFNNMESNTVSC
ncbi:hypothetical protein PV327_003011 [Microctonus hyperodae]|uniref:AAA-ATPase-like domain-containing protein n=1 Tax=Microctonus hyperodae TaxID=165561 RepID=A0AA39G3G3_MICHY|nr:hypothetical protein PV327_003011 [Microctonus hyperodae]